MPHNFDPVPERDPDILVKRFFIAGWGSANNNFTSLGALPPSVFGSPVTPFGNPGFILADDIEAMWIGSFSDANAVLFNSPAQQDKVVPCMLSVDSPWIGRLSGQLQFWQYTPLANNGGGNGGHILEIYYVPRGYKVPSQLPIKRGPKRYYSTLACGAAGAFGPLLYFPTYGRKTVQVCVDNTGVGDAVTLKIQYLYGAIDLGLAYIGKPTDSLTTASSYTLTTGAGNGEVTGDVISERLALTPNMGVRAADEIQIQATHVGAGTPNCNVTIYMSD